VSTAAGARRRRRSSGSRRKHRGLIKAVHEELVPEGVLAAEQAVAFDGLYAQRLDADDGDFVDIPHEQVVNTPETARSFVAAMQTALERP
jgi:uncharacterized protein (UPF0332 family)